MADFSPELLRKVEELWRRYPERKAALLPQNGHADQAYYEKHIAIVDEQLALAGLRLAAVLNAILK